MKIAIIPGTFFPHPGGAQVQIHNLANKLIENKIDVKCYVFEKSNLNNNKYQINHLNKIILNFVFIMKYYFNLKLYFILNLYLKSLIKKNQFDLWHFNFINYKSLILIDCLKKLNQKVLVTFQGVDIQINKSINYGYRLDIKYEKYLNEIINNIDYFTSLSQTIKKDLINLKVSNNKIELIPNAVDLNKFNIIKKTKNDDSLNLITVARYAKEKKGFDLLPKVAKVLLDNKISFNWKIIGKNVSKLKNNELIKNNISYFSFFEDIIDFKDIYLPSNELVEKYLDSHLYINLSRIESFGITFVEALASGIPVITFDTKGVNEIIINEYNGVIIEKEKFENFCEKIVYFSKNKNLLNKFNEGIYKSKKKYDLNLVTNQFINVYNKLIN